MRRHCMGRVAVAVWLGLAATARAASYKVIHSFVGGTHGGSYPASALVQVGNKLYGTTEYGGNPACTGGCGTVFWIDWQTYAAGVLYYFKGPSTDGSNPIGGLTYFGGTLYGVTTYGLTAQFASGAGGIFSVRLSTGDEKLLYSFSYSTGADPNDDLAVINGRLYGTTYSGPYGEVGTVFSLNRTTGTEKILYSFTETGTNGQFPLGSVIDVGGTLYGTTYEGGDSFLGTVFSISLTSNAEEVIYSFKPGPDGNGPSTTLIDVGGTLYGVTANGGSGTCACGTVFSLNLNSGTEKVVHSFQGGSDGANPVARLVYADGILYGVTVHGGAHAGGTVFAVNPTTGTETVLHAFGGTGDGKTPYFGLTYVDGQLFGATSAGGAHGSGTVFVVAP